MRTDMSMRTREYFAFIRRAGQALADHGPDARIGAIDIVAFEGKHILWPDWAEDVTDPDILVVDGSLADAIDVARR